MKTSGLTGIEAIKALAEDRCDSFESEKDMTFWSSLDNGISLNRLLTETFRLINPKPRTEKVEVKRWYCTNCQQSQGSPGECCNKTLVELTGHYERPLPDPEPVEFEGVIAGNDPLGFRINLLNQKRLDAYFGGRRVRVIVEP